LLIS
jgi:pre-mRNA-splicing factor ATP-dependent RNA helicase DHX16